MTHAARTIHRLFTSQASKFYKGAALDSAWKQMSLTDRVHAVCAVILAAAAMALLLFR